MEADSASETQLRHLYSASRTSQTDSDVLDPTPVSQSLRAKFAIQAVENEEMPTKADQGTPHQGRCKSSAA